MAYPSLTAELEQLALLVRESEAGRRLASSDIAALLAKLVDIVVQFAFIGGRRVMTELRYGAGEAACGRG
jgi:hypothetical protein